MGRSRRDDRFLYQLSTEIHEFHEFMRYDL